MAIKCGIVGLPNVGKSTLFNALTQAGIGAENFPFCTIEPNHGVVAVPDPRQDAIANIVSPERNIPTTVEFVDIAGLVSGASKGEGLGNKFLDHIRQTHAITHVVRCFQDSNVVHVAGQVDPIDDIETIDTELALADLATVEKSILRLTKLSKTGDAKVLAEKSFLEDKVLPVLNEGHAARTLDLDEDEIKWLQPLCLITRKPLLYIANVDESGFDNNPMLDKVMELAQKQEAEVVTVCAKIESEIAELDDEDKQSFLEDLGLSEPGLNKVIRAAYKLLGLQTFFTAGKTEVRAWTVERGATAPEAAGVIHTDFQKGFIRAETVAYDDYIAGNGEQGAKDAGKWRLEGKEYIAQDGDVFNFRFNV